MRVLLVDYYPVTRLGARILLQGVEEVEIAGEAARGGEALRMAEELRPDLVVLDPDLEGEPDGWEVCRRLKSLAHPPRVLIYSTSDSKEDVAAASLAGADSYLSKKCKSERLPETVDRTHSGERISLLSQEEENGSGTRLKARIEEADLTPRQREVANLMVNRRTNEEIAKQLHVSVNTVKTHIRYILRELKAESRQKLSELDSS